MKVGKIIIYIVQVAKPTFMLMLIISIWK